MTDATTSLARPEDGLPVERVGRYRLLRVLGEGGMGVVYEAEQTDPIRRRVALKIVRAELSSRDVAKRFEVERQALAVMKHDGIAQVLDAGTSEAGRPWFAMELVRGAPITEYCDVHKLTTRRRAELMISVCLAVQHAHHKGVIHRDLKPANVLVTENDGKPLPKIIDFGIAKAVGHFRASETLVTMFGQAIGTPAYMSPEQAELSGLDVDTRTDVYSLGVMLYELLVGRLPEDPQTLGLQQFLVRLASRETAVLAPSVRLSNLSAERDTLAMLRQTSAEGLGRELQGDLDWIVMKAMEPDRDRRYETANGLALDLGRFLADEPIQARPPSASYRVRKFIRRHRGGVAAAAAIALAVLSGATAATVGLVRASRSESRANQEAATAQRVSEFLSGLFSQAVPDRASAATITARQVLDSGAARIEKELSDQPLVQARLMQTIGTAYRDLGLYEPAERLLRQALATRERVLGPNAADLSSTLTELGSLQTAQARYADAEATLARALQTAPVASGDGGIQRAMTQLALADLHFRRGRYAEAKGLMAQTLPELERAFGAESDQVADATWSLARMVSEGGKPAEAEALHRRVLQIRERLHGPDHRSVAQVLSTLASSLYSQGKLEEAESLYRRALSLETAVYGSTHTIVAIDVYNLGLVLGDRGKHAEAIGLLERAQHVWEALFGPDHPYVGSALSAQGERYAAMGREADAIPLLQRALAIKQQKLAPGHSSIASTQYDLGEAYRKTRRFRESGQYLRGALQSQEKNLDPASNKVALSLAALARLHRDKGDLVEAERTFARAVTQWERSGRSQDAVWSDLVRDHAEVLRRLGRSSEAAALLRRLSS